MTRDDFWFFQPFRVRYSEIDGQGVVFNAHYLTYFDTSITEYFRALDYDQQADARATGIDFHVVRTLVEYKAPIRLDQDIEVGVRVGKLGRASLTFGLAIFPRGAPDLLATGEVVWVNTDQRTHTSVPIGQPIRDLLSSRDRQPASP